MKEVVYFMEIAAPGSDGKIITKPQRLLKDLRFGFGFGSCSFKYGLSLKLGDPF